MAPAESLDYISQLKSPLDCETVMKNAKAKGRTDVYNSAFRRKCELAGLANEDPSDPLIRAFYETLSAREELLREKHGGKHIKAAYTRRMVQKHGVVYCLSKWAGFGNQTTDGFDDFIEAGMADMTAEALVVRFPDRFPHEVVAQARQRLMNVSALRAQTVDGGEAIRSCHLKLRRFS
jgi:hypothetical protein